MAQYVALPKSISESPSKALKFKARTIFFPISKCRTAGRHAGDHHGRRFPNGVLCVDISEDTYRRIALTVNLFLLNHYCSLTVLFWGKLSIVASSHRKNMILTSFESIFHTEITQY